MQAITTRYHGPTNYRGSRISARYAGGTSYTPYDHALSLDGNHAAAAEALATKLGWLNRFTLASGTCPTGDQCHVLIPREPQP